MAASEYIVYHSVKDDKHIILAGISTDERIDKAGTSTGARFLVNFYSNQEEAVTRMIPCIQHPSEQ